MSDDNVNIYSGVDDTGTAVCTLEWGSIRTVLTPTMVTTTAQDLTDAASRAETDIALIRVMERRLGANMQTIGAFLRDIREHRPMNRGKSALRIEAVAGARTGEPYVHIGRGSMGGSLSPDEARAMATNWHQTAVAAHMDARLRYVLGDYPQLTPADIDGIFTGLRRAGGDQITERHT